MIKIKKKGFTLIELLVVISIMALLMIVVIMLVPNLLDKSKSTINKVSYANIVSASINYVNEFKTTNDYWYEEISNEGLTGNEFTCTTISQMINKGFLKDNLVDAETGDPIDNNTTIKVVRDSNKVIIEEIINNSSECDRTLPEVKIEILGSSLLIQNEEWYYDNVAIEILPLKKGVDIDEFEYYIVNLDNNKKVFDNSEDGNLNYEKKFYDIKSILNNVTDYEKYGKNVKVCANLKNKNDMSNTICEIVNIDITVPVVPDLKSSDNIDTDNWHKDKFTLNVSGGGNSPSGITYKYGTSIDSITNDILDNKIKVEDYEKNEYFVRACNNVGVCSNSISYISKIDNIKPVIYSFERGTLDYVTSLNLIGSIQDNESGIIKYKISRDSEYNNLDWINIDSIVDKINVSNVVNNNDEYYLWVLDASGNYNSSVIFVDNIDLDGPQYVSGGKVSKGSITEANFSDFSSPVTVYYFVNNSNKTPSSEQFSSTSRTFSISCGNTYYAYAKAVDKLGNYTIKYLGNVVSDSCCDEGNWGREYCNYDGWLESSRYNECIGAYEYDVSDNACSSDDYYCDDWGECESNGTQYRTCYYYYGGEKNSYEASTSCEYDDGSSGQKWYDSSSFYTNSSSCSEEGFDGGGVCYPIDPNNWYAPGMTYSCNCCYAPHYWNGAGSCVG